MLFLFGRKNPAIRALVGALLLVAGVIIHGGVILIGIGAVLLVWAGALALKAHRINRQEQVTRDTRVS